MDTRMSRLVLVLGMVAIVTLAMPVRPAAAAVPAPRPTPAPTRPAGVFSGSVQVTNVSVLIRATDAAGRPITDLRANEVEVREDGVPAENVSLEPVAPRGGAAPVPPPPAPAVKPVATPPAAVTSPSVNVTIYVQADLINRGQMGWVVKGLRHEAAKLVALGPVRLVVADPYPVVAAEGISTAEELDQALKGLKKHAHVYSSIERIRIDFRRNVVGASDNLMRRLALASAGEELRRVSDSVDRLRGWNSKQRLGGGRVLVLVSGGFEYDPWSYYSAFLDASSQAPPNPETEGANKTDELSQRIQNRGLNDQQAVQLPHMWQDVSRELVGNGWTVLGFSGGLPGMNPTTAAETSGKVEATSFFDRGSRQPAGAALVNQGTTVSFGLDPLRRAARDSGGSVATSPDQLAKDLTSLDSAYVLSYTMGRPPDSKVHHLQVVVRRPGVKVMAPTVSKAVSRPASDRERARELLAGHGGPGDVPFEVEVKDVTGSRRKGYSGRLVVTGHLGQVLPLLLTSKAPRMEITVAVDTGTNEPFISQEQPMPLRLADREGTWIYESPIQWPHGAKAVAVVVSEITTDTWGGAVAKLR